LAERAQKSCRPIDRSDQPYGADGFDLLRRYPLTGDRPVLKIVQESEAAVQAGTPLLQIGDPLDLEVVADLLSTDAVQISPGAPVRIDGWGGTPIKGRVKRIDPAGFLKVSALGIEEQRVRVTIDFADPPETWSRLGHEAGQ
jgi:HlyD family secretion protein